MINKLFPAVLLLVICLGGCQNRGNVRDHINSEELSGFDQVDEVKEVYYRFPSPDEMLSFIDHEALYFNDEILLPIENANRFLDSKSQAMNLGVYIADLAYITLFQRQKEALTYFQAVYGLSDKLRISSAFNPGMLKRFENNLGNVDSLKVLADISLTDITNHLVKHNNERVLAVISIGGFVESLYLAFRITEKYSEDNMIVQRISDQKLVLDNLMNYALEFAGDKNVSDAISSIHTIRAAYNELIVSSGETSVSKSDDGKLIISGGNKISITEDQFNKLREATYNSRRKITENLEN